MKIFFFFIVLTLLLSCKDNNSVTEYNFKEFFSKISNDSLQYKFDGVSFLDISMGKKFNPTYSLQIKDSIEVNVILKDDYTYEITSYYEYNKNVDTNEISISTRDKLYGAIDFCKKLNIKGFKSDSDGFTIYFLLKNFDAKTLPEGSSNFGKSNETMGSLIYSPYEIPYNNRNITPILLTNDWYFIIW